MNDAADPSLTTLKSVDEMLAVAHAMEREAAARYAMLADCMRRVDQGETAELLDDLATEERGHVESVERLAQQKVHHAPDASLLHGTPPGTFLREDEASAYALLSPYRTLSIAVRHEERAFAFWTYVAAQSDKGALRELAETFARQELIHAAKLRHARRRAYHAERSTRPRRVRDPHDGLSPAEIRAEAARLEAGFAAFCVAAERQLRSGTDLTTANLFQTLGNDAQRAVAALNPIGFPAASELDRQTAMRRSEMHGVNGAALLFEAAGIIDGIDYRYLDWLETSAQQEDVRELEVLAQAATWRLARINERLYALEPAIAALPGLNPGTRRSGER
jgi:rubrerythrin